MEVRAGYKSTVFGMIPADWDLKKIGPEIDLLTGCPFPSSGYTDTGVRLLRGSNVKRGVTDWTPDITQHWPFVSSDHAKYALDLGDLVIAMDGSLVGRSFARLVADDLPALLLQRVARIRSKNLSVSYLTAFVGSDWFIRYVDSVKTVTAIPHISPSDIEGFSIPVPPTYDEQERIATALSDVDALIAGLEKLIAKKRDLKQAAMQQLLTGQTRLPGFSGEWKKTKLGDVATFFKGKGLPKSALTSDGSEPCIHYGELFTHYAETIAAITSRTNGARDLFRSVANDVLMPTSDVTPRGLAKASCVNIDGVILGGDILIIRPDSLRVFGSFLSYVIRREEEQVLRLVTGSTVYHLYGSDMKKFEFVLPSVPEQTAIVTVLAEMHNELTALEFRLAKTRDLKQGMMQELLTGRTRLV